MIIQNEGNGGQKVGSNELAQRFYSSWNKEWMYHLFNDIRINWVNLRFVSQAFFLKLFNNPTIVKQYSVSLCLLAF